MGLKFWKRKEKEKEQKDVLEVAEEKTHKPGLLNNKRKRDTVAVFSVEGDNVEIILVEEIDNKVKFNKKDFPTPLGAYHLTGVKGLKNIDLTNKPMRMIGLDKLKPALKTLHIGEVKDTEGIISGYTYKMIETLLKNSVMQGMFSSLDISLGTMGLYMAGGVAVYEVLKWLGFVFLKWFKLV